MSVESAPEIIALVTDFGTRDYFVGAMKGVVLSINRRAVVVDITHEIAAQDVRAASFVLRACCEDFPPKTVFVAVVDPGVGSNRKAILVEAKDRFFLAPDNGLLAFLSGAAGDFRAFELSNEQYFRNPVSRTFHGRDVFAACAAHLSAGIAPERFGAEIFDFVPLEEKQPKNSGNNRIEAEIIHIDRFGNLVTNLRKTNAPENFTVKIGEKTIEKMCRFYSQAGRGEIFMIWGSAGFLEIVAFCDSAARLLGANVGDSLTIDFTAETQRRRERQK